MIHAVAIGPDDAVYSVKRGGGLSRVVANAADRAEVLYETSDKLDAIWVSAEGTVHAVGKRYHSNRGGAWKASKLPVPAFSLWGTSDDELFVGGMNGELLRGKEGAWTELANAGELCTAIHGTGSSSVYFAGFGFLREWDGSTMHARPLDGSDTPYLQGVRCAGNTTWFCTTDALYASHGGEARKLATAEDEIYGVGIGDGGIFVHNGTVLLRLDGDRFVECRNNDDGALMVKNATYSTAITSNGHRVVAGGARSVLVDDGKGFLEWPEPSAAAKTAKAAAKPSTKSAWKASKAKAPATAAAKRVAKPAAKSKAKPKRR